MIALCLKHAGLADAPRWTDDQLRQMKSNPYMRGKDLGTSYDYLRKNTVCKIGNIGYATRNILEIDGERVIGFNIDPDGYYRLNLLIRDSQGKEILRMDDNFWTAYTSDLYDISCSARGKELEITSKDEQTHFKMRFDDYPLDRFVSMLKEKAGFEDNTIEWFVKILQSPKFVPVWSITGTLEWGGRTIAIRENEIEEMKTHNTFGSNLVVNRPSVLGFKGHSIMFG